MNEFRGLLLDIAQHLRTEELEGLKFYCSSFIPAGRAEFLSRPHELFLELERMGKLSENNREFLAVLFIKIGRNDLRNKLLQLPEGPLYGDRPLRQEIRTATNVPLDFFNQRVSTEITLDIAEKISTSWKFLGRHLKLPEHTLSNIEDTYRRTEERSHEMLTKWLQTSETPTALVLIRALDKCGRRDLAEFVENRVGGGARSTGNIPRENTDARGQRPFPNMHDLQANLPGNGERHTRQPVQEQDKDQNDGTAREQQNRWPTEDALPDRPGAEDSVNPQPVQVTDLDDIKKPGSLWDSSTYEILDQLGKGGFAEVVCVLEKRTNKYFAVKKVDLGENDATTKEKVDALEKEIKLLKVLDNPYVVKYYKTDTDLHTLALFMEYMPGGSIAKKLSTTQRLEQELVRKYTWQLLKGLEYLHANKVIHRDIKGANVLLDESQQRVKLSDFGISICVEGIVTSTGNCISNKLGLFASVFWTSPELLCSESYSCNTDIWSLGCTVVEMLTGNPPLRAKNAVMVQVMYKISTCSIEPPDECSSFAKEFLEQCFLKKSQRPSAKDLLETSEFPCPQPE